MNFLIFIMEIVGILVIMVMRCIVGEDLGKGF